MTSFNNFVLLILLTISLNILVGETGQEHQAIPSEEEKKELERQLKAINKPPIKSFKTKEGEIFDCIDIHKQLAFHHHLLKNHSLQLKPTTIPEWIMGNNISQKVGPSQHLQEGINCPDGTVIVKRTTMQDLMHEHRLKSMGFDGPGNVFRERNNNDSTGQFYFATVAYGPSSFTGLKANLNIWDPQVSQDQSSIAFMSIGGGRTKELFATISVGWMVNPSLYQGEHARLYTAWTARGYKTGCYDIRCPGFVQVSKKITLGIPVLPVSIYDGQQYELRLSLYQDRAKGDWWFACGDENIGYWPASLFAASRFANKANHAILGGEVYSPRTENGPVMGSGHWPNEGFKKAAFVNGIKIMDGSGKVLDPETDSMKAHMTNPNCYRAIYVHEHSDPWLNVVFYGGPAGCIGK